MNRYRRTAVALLVVLSAFATSAGEKVIPPGREADAGDLVAGLDLPAGYRWTSIDLQSRTIEYTLALDGRRVGSMVLSPRERHSPLKSRSFAITVRASDPGALAVLEEAARYVVRRERGGFYVEVKRERAKQDSRRETRSTILSMIGVFLLFLAALAWTRRTQIELSLKPSHLVPSLLQVAIFSYWALYLPPVIEHIPFILLQLAFAYGLEGLLSIWRNGRWRIGLGPVPIVLSTNLFVWFNGPAFWVGLLAVGIATVSKWTIRRADGRHIFNPSALGIALVAIPGFLAPGTFDYIDIAHRIAIPPNMFELMLVLALIAQLRFPIVTIPLFATLMLIPLNEISLQYGFVTETGRAIVWPAWPPVFLAIALLATDPATIPRRGLGRVFFGIFLGAGIWMASVVLVMSGMSDFYSKVLPIPLLNLAAPLFDRASDAAPSILQRLLEPRWNAAHVAVWLAAAAWLLAPARVKADRFQAEWVWFDRLNLHPLVRNERGEVLCADNPVFCRPFSWWQELGLLRSGRKSVEPPRRDPPVRLGGLRPGDAIGGGWTVHDLRPEGERIRVGLEREGERLVFVLALKPSAYASRTEAIGDLWMWMDTFGEPRRDVQMQLVRRLRTELGGAANAHRFTALSDDLRRNWFAGAATAPDPLYDTELLRDRPPPARRGMRGSGHPATASGRDN